MDENTKDATIVQDISDKHPKDKLPLSKNNCSVFEYLKKESSLLIASISACAAIVAACMKLGAYFKQVAYLRYWNIDLELLSESETYWLENIALSFAMIVSVFGFLSFLRETNIIHAKNRILIHYGWRELKERKRTISERKKVYQKEKSKKKKTMQFEVIQSEVKEYKTDRLELLHTEGAIWVQYLAHLVLALVFFGTVITLALLQSVEHLDDAIKKSALISIAFCVMIGITEAHQSKEEKALLKEVFDEAGNDAEIVFPNYPIKKIFQNGVKSHLSNRNLISMLFYLLAICAVFLFNSFNEGQIQAQNKKNHLEIMMLNNQEYALVANDKDYVIGERIERDSLNTSAIIFTNEQIIIQKESISFYVFSFDELVLEQSTKAVIP